jgi:hypothetical protein
MDFTLIKCTECDALILPSTASANGGLCAHCAKTPEFLRRARREFDAKVASGLVFRPTLEERGSAKHWSVLFSREESWNLDPEYYKDQVANSIGEEVERASTQSEGYVFLLADSGTRCSLSFKETYGVCEYQSETYDEHLYADSPKNLREQVHSEQHVIQACSCCGVGLLWYPSRFHMPREFAFHVFSSFILGKPELTTLVEWIDCGDISYTSRGRG